MKQMRAISINKELYNQPLDSPEEIKKMRKMKIELYLPPSDIPQFIYPEYKEKEDNLIIEFKYMDKEKEKELFDRENVRFTIGEFSGKPLKIEIRNIKKENINRIELINKIGSINKLIEENITKIRDLREKSNLSIAREILSQNANELVNQVL